MNSKSASSLDDVYDRLQWAGEEYILDELDEEAECWPGFHTFDVEMAIDDLKEIHRQKSYHISPAPGSST